MWHRFFICGTHEAGSIEVNCHCSSFQLLNCNLKFHFAILNDSGGVKKAGLITEYNDENTRVDESGK